MRLGVVHSGQVLSTLDLGQNAPVSPLSSPNAVSSLGETLDGPLHCLSVGHPGWFLHRGIFHQLTKVLSRDMARNIWLVFGILPADEGLQGSCSPVEGRIPPDTRGIISNVGMALALPDQGNLLNLSKKHIVLCIQLFLGIY